MIEQVAPGEVCTVTLASPPGAAPLTDTNSTVVVASGARVGVAAMPGDVVGDGTTPREGAEVWTTVSETPGVVLGFAEGPVG